LRESSIAEETTEAAASHQNGSVSVFGTPGYLAPEQLRGGTVDHRADLFNLGAILFEMLTGQQPFQGKSTSEILKTVLNDLPSRRKRLAVDSIRP
jgi:serine/threonine protein kinase